MKVYGYNGASSSAAYTLRVSTQSVAWRLGSTEPAALSSAAPEQPVVKISNPVTAGEQAWLTVHGYAGPAELRLRDARGLPVGSSTRAEFRAGQPLGYTLPAGLRAGVYVVTVQLPTHVQTLKLLVQ